MDARAIHGTDGAPVAGAVGAPRATAAARRAGPSHINLNRYLATHRPVPSPYYRGPTRSAAPEQLRVDGVLYGLRAQPAGAGAGDGGTMVPNRSTKDVPQRHGFS